MWLAPKVGETAGSQRQDSFQGMWGRGSFGGETAFCSNVPIVSSGESEYTLRLQTVRGKFVTRYKLPGGTIYSGEGASIGSPPAYRPEQPGNEGSQSVGTSETKSEWEWSLGAGLNRITARPATTPTRRTPTGEPRRLW